MREISTTLGDLLFHLTDYNTGEESFVLAIEIEKASKVLAKYKTKE